MKSLAILHQITLPHSPKPNQFPHTTTSLPQIHRTRWSTQASAKGFAKNRESISRKNNTAKEEQSSINGDNYNDEEDDKIPDAVWERMIKRILFYVGVPLGIGFASLYLLDVLNEQQIWRIPKLVQFLTIFITFGASTIGIVYGSLSTSFDAEEEGSLLGFEQVEKNWGEMWKEEDGSGK